MYTLFEKSLERYFIPIPLPPGRLVENLISPPWYSLGTLRRKLHDIGPIAMPSHKKSRTKSPIPGTSSSHQGLCSFAGVYQLELLMQEKLFGEFCAFSNVYHVWKCLQLQPRSSIEELESKGQQVCSQSWEELVQYNMENVDFTLDEDALAIYWCTIYWWVDTPQYSGVQWSYSRSSLTEQTLLYDPVSTPPTLTISCATATDSNPTITLLQLTLSLTEKLAWPLGYILYEINTLPWDYIQVHGQHHIDKKTSEYSFDK